MSAKSSCGPNPETHGQERNEKAMSKQKASTPAPFGQWVLGATLGGLAVGAGAISLGMNATYGLKSGLGFAAFFVMCDIAKLSIPAIAQVNGKWGMHERITWIFVFAISVLSACSYLMESQSTRILQMEASTKAVDGAEADAARARTELAAITETASVAALQGLVDTSEASAKASDDKAAEEAKSRCLDRCKGHQEAAAAHRKEKAGYLLRLGEAQRRDKLQALLADAKATAKATPKEALGAVDAIAYLTGIEKARIANNESLLKMIMLLIASELLAMFIGQSTALLKDCIARRRKSAGGPVAQPAPSASAPSDAESLTPKEATLLKIQMKALHSPGHVLVSSRRQLAEELGVKKTTFQNWFKGWVEAGEIEASDNGGKVQIKAVRKAA